MLEIMQGVNNTLLVDENGNKFTLYELENSIVARLTDIFKVIDLDHLTLDCSIYYTPMSYGKYIKCLFRYNGETYTSMIPFDDILDKEHLIGQIIHDIASFFKKDDEQKTDDTKTYIFRIIDGMPHDELVELINYAVRRL